MAIGMMTVVTNQASLESELASFIGEYERANNSHDIERVVPFIAEDATYWFSDGSYQGIGETLMVSRSTIAAQSRGSVQACRPQCPRWMISSAPCRRSSTRGLCGGRSSAR